jgi:hypothetical protein
MSRTRRQDWCRRPQRLDHIDLTSGTQTTRRHRKQRRQETARDGRDIAGNRETEQTKRLKGKPDRWRDSRLDKRAPEARGQTKTPPRQRPVEVQRGQMPPEYQQ